MSDHAWRQLLQVGSAPSTDTVEQCRTCGIVRHVYSYATLERQLSTERRYSLGELVPVGECVGLLGMLPAAQDTESSAEPVL